MGNIIIIVVLICTISLGNTLFEDKFDDSQMTEADHANVNGTKVFNHIFDPVESSIFRLLWAGDDYNQLLILIYNKVLKNSWFYQSKDGGQTFLNTTEKLANISVYDILISPVDKKKVLLLGNIPNLSQTVLFYSKDAGKSFEHKAMPCVLQGIVHFHPKISDYLLALGKSKSKKWAYLSRNFGSDWIPLASDIEDIKWDKNYLRNDSGIYLLKQTNITSDGRKLFELIRTTADDNQLIVLGRNILSFEHQNKFLFAALYSGEKPNEITLQVSTSSGVLWNDVELPTLQSDDLYRILDSSEDVIFIHIDGPGSYGTLYISDGNGIVFTKKLERHWCAKVKVTCAFYGAESIREVYLTSKVLYDKTIQTVISFNRGASWQPLKSIENGICANISKVCNLQIAYPYSKNGSSLISQGPLSIKTAPSLILTHGFSSPNATDSPHVYVSNDGGYSWYESLSGIYFYIIVNHGSLLAAVPSTHNKLTNNIWFSTNEGQTWRLSKFSNTLVNVTSLITDPLSSSLQVAVIAQFPANNSWLLSVINFSSFLKNECNSSDFESVLAHENSSANSTMKGCVLGVKQTYQRLKQQAWCYLNSSYQPLYKEKTCPCTMSSFECDYGYYKPHPDKFACEPTTSIEGKGKYNCTGRRFDQKSIRYRKVAGNKCSGGWDPGKWNSHEKECKKAGMTATDYIIAVITVIVVATILGMSVYFIRKFEQLNRLIPSYRYSALNDEPSVINGVEDKAESQALVSASTEEEDDDESEETSSPPTLLVQSQTMMTVNGSAIIPAVLSDIRTKTEETVPLDSDDELLQ